MSGKIINLSLTNVRKVPEGIIIERTALVGANERINLSNLDELISLTNDIIKFIESEQEPFTFLEVIRMVLGITSSEYKKKLKQLKYFCYVEGKSYEWPAKIISGHEIRKLASVPVHLTLFAKYKNQQRIIVTDDDKINLFDNDLEEFYSQLL